MRAGSGYVRSKEEFGDCQLHIEWSAPSEVKGDSQGRGNSGVFLMGRWRSRCWTTTTIPLTPMDSPVRCTAGGGGGAQSWGVAGLRYCVPAAPL
jgi:hypothetical protein